MLGGRAPPTKLDAGACRAEVQAPLRSLCDYAYLFVAGVHHSGTSLVHELLATRADAARLNKKRFQGEGQHAQRVWRPFKARDAASCAGDAPLSDAAARDPPRGSPLHRSILAARPRSRRG